MRAGHQSWALFVVVVLFVFVVVRASGAFFGLVVIVEEVPSLWRQVVWVVCGGPGRGAKDADGRRRFTSSAAQPAHPGGECRRELAYRHTTRAQVTSIGLVGLVRSSRLHVT